MSCSPAVSAPAILLTPAQARPPGQPVPAQHPSRVAMQILRHSQIAMTMEVYRARIAPAPASRWQSRGFLCRDCGCWSRPCSPCVGDRCAGRRKLPRPAAVSPAARASTRYSPQATTVTKMSDLPPDAPPPSSPLARRTAVVSCWLCGIRLHQNQMVPDGGSACLDIRWYCKDIRACTDRGFSAQRQRRAAEAAAPGKATAAPSVQTAKPSADDRLSQPGSRLAPADQSAGRAAEPDDGHQAGAGDRQPAGSAQSRLFRPVHH
jgi:hypothetical protein